MKEKKDLTKNQKIATVVISGIVTFLFLSMFLGEAAKKADPSLAEQSQDNQPTQEIQPEQPQEPKKFIDIIKVTTEQDKQTKTFDLLGGEQKLKYSSTGGDYSLCYIYIVEEGKSLDIDGGFPEVSLDGTQEGETFLRKSTGRYYLHIKTVNGSCSASLTELQ